MIESGAFDTLNWNVFRGSEAGFCRVRYCGPLTGDA
jgi:hypothetical protein